MDFFDENGNGDKGFLDKWEGHLLERYHEQIGRHEQDPTKEPPALELSDNGRLDEGKNIEEFNKGYTNGYLLTVLAPELTLRFGIQGNSLYARGFERGQIDKVFNDAPNNRGMTAEDRLEVARLLTKETGSAKELEILNKVNGRYNYDTGFSSGFLVSKYVPDILKEISRQYSDSSYEQGLKDGCASYKKETSKGTLLGIADKYLPSWLRLNSPENDAPEGGAKDKEIGRGIEPDL